MALTFGQALACRDRRQPARVAFRVLAGAVMVVAILAAFPDAHVHALDAAGSFKGTPIPGVKAMVEHLKDSLVWLGITLTSLVVAVIGLMFMAGHSRAQDFAVKTVVGLLILGSISGIVA